MADQLPEEVKAARLDTLMTLQQEISLVRNRQRIGHTEAMLIEEVRDNGIAIGRSQHEAPDADGICRISGAKGKEPGTFVSVRITDTDAYDITGVMQ